MDAYPYASSELVAATETLLGEPIAQSECALLKQIAKALGGGSAASVETALGGSPLGRSEVTLLKQILVLIATA